MNRVWNWFFPPPTELSVARRQLDASVLARLDAEAQLEVAHATALMFRERCVRLTAYCTNLEEEGDFDE